MVEIFKLILNIEIPKSRFDQDLCRTCDMNSTLGSVVPLAMFLNLVFFQLSMVGVILINYILCVLPAIVVQELHTRGRGFEWVGVTFNMVCRFWMVTIRLNS